MGLRDNSETKGFAANMARRELREIACMALEAIKDHLNADKTWNSAPSPEQKALREIYDKTELVEHQLTLYLD